MLPEKWGLRKEQIKGSLSFMHDIKMFVDEHFFKVLSFTQTHIQGARKGTMNVDLPTTCKLLMIRGINDLIRQQASIDPDFSRKLKAMIDKK